MTKMMFPRSSFLDTIEGGVQYAKQFDYQVTYCRNKECRFNDGQRDGVGLCLAEEINHDGHGVCTTFESARDIDMENKESKEKDCGAK